MCYKYRIRTRYVHLDFVTMRLGGVSTRNCRYRLLGLKETIRACKRLGIRTNRFCVALKYVIKIYGFVVCHWVIYSKWWKYITRVWRIYQYANHCTSSIKIPVFTVQEQLCLSMFRNDICRNSVAVFVVTLLRFWQLFGREFSPNSDYFYYCPLKKYDIGLSA